MYRRIILVCNTPSALSLHHNGYVGPAYIVGAPGRNIADGKVVMASYEQLKSEVKARCANMVNLMDQCIFPVEHRPFLLTLRITDPAGNAIPNASFDYWQVHILIP
jgi:hypothetical protein